MKARIQAAKDLDDEFASGSEQKKKKSFLSEQERAA